MTEAARGETGSAIRDVVTALGLSVSVNLSEKHAITMQTHCDQAASAEHIDALLDKMVGRADRLVSRYRVRELRKQLAMQEMQFKHMVEDLARIDAAHANAWKASNKKGPFQRSNQQEAERNNAIMTRQRFEEVIAKLKVEIADLEKEAA